jgi:hypothetical protein
LGISHKVRSAIGPNTITALTHNPMDRLRLMAIGSAIKEQDSQAAIAPIAIKAISHV